MNSASPATPDTPPRVVLDTNAVLDWLVFRHPACESWFAHFAAGSVRWLASEAMRGELRHVLGRGVASAWQPDLTMIDATWERLVLSGEAPPTAAAAPRLRCTDGDDQKFIDLALAHRARWLVSRDRAVLKLSRRARLLDLEVLTPEAWTAALNPD